MKNHHKRHTKSRWQVLALCLLCCWAAGCQALPVINLIDPASLADKKLVVLWHAFSGAEAEALQTLTDRFNATNPWDIILITEGQGNILEKLGADPGARPDLVTVWPEDLAAYTSLGLLSSELSLEPLPEGMLPMAAALYQVNGRARALPLGLASYVLYYNSEWLADLGYDPTVAGWEELRRTACGATNPMAGQVGVGMPAQAGMVLALLSAGGAEIVGDDGYYNFAGPAGVSAIERLHQLLSAEQCGLVYEDWDTGPLRLSKSSMAMIVESTQRAPQIEATVIAGRNFALGAGGLPGPAGPGPSLWYGPGLTVLAPAGERRSDALRVARWFLSPEAQQIWSDRTAYLPVRRSLLEAHLAEVEEDTPSLPLQTQLWQFALTAADQGAWVAWPRDTNRIACRASLLRGLLAVNAPDAIPGAYVDTAVTACNTGVRQAQ